MKSILLTGSSGLIGVALSAALHKRGRHPVGLDLRGAPDFRLDVRNIYRSGGEFDSVSGIIHLAAVSRVIAGELEPELCWSVNVEGTQAVLGLASDLPLRPWVIYASSREIYGEQSTLPVREDAPPRPLNIYARSKVAAEQLISGARDGGLAACTVRFSSVYGSVHDYPDRVIPAFAVAAARGGSLRVDNPHGLLDFTHIGDAVDGVLRLVDLLEAPNSTPPSPIHLTSGCPTSLGDLADLAVELGGPTTSIGYAEPRSYDVNHFYGDPARAAEVLGWRARTDLRTGFTRLVSEFRSADSLVRAREHVSAESEARIKSGGGNWL
jgi:nucleoside-diphosphate-sugar epimerase